MALALSPLECADPCYLCDRNPYSLTKNPNPCPGGDVEQARELGYCSYAVIDGAWTTITQDDIFPIGAGIILPREPENPIFTEVAILKKLEKVSIEGPSLTQ